jgi:hypothetical protein
MAPVGMDLEGGLRLLGDRLWLYGVPVVWVVPAVRVPVVRFAGIGVALGEYRELANIVIKLHVKMFNCKSIRNSLVGRGRKYKEARGEAEETVMAIQEWEMSGEAAQCKVRRTN